MILKHFYPNLSELEAGFRTLIETGPAAYLPWLNQSLAQHYAQGDKWTGPWLVHPNIQQHLINRGFINAEGSQLSEIGYLDVEGPSAFTHAGQRIGFTPERAAVYQALRGRVGEILPPQMHIGFFALTDTPAHWRGAFPADRIDVIHRQSGAVFVSGYFHSTHPDPATRFTQDTNNAMRAIKWHSRARGDMSVPLIAFVWNKWKDPQHTTRQFIPLDLWRRWLRLVKHEAMVDGLCYFGGKTDAEIPYYQAFSELA